MKNSWVFFVLTFVSILHIGVCLTCHKCEPTAEKPCLTVPEKEPPVATCTTDETSCYVQISGSKVTRGCLKDTDKAKCESDKDFCKICNGENNCNKDEVFKRDCIQCDSSTDHDCQRKATPQENCVIEIKENCTSYVFDAKNACFIARNGNSVIRGCLSQLKADWSSTLSEKNDKCVDDLSCYTCNSVDDPECATKDNKNWNGTCAYGVACYSCGEPDKISKRGCGKADSDTCSYCYENNCNKPKRCFSCDDKDSNCAEGDAKLLKANSCKAENDACVVYINDSGKTIRGCKEGKECKEENNCRACDGFQCNGILYPENRIKCYQCTNCKELPASTACKTYVKGDKCYVNSENKDNMSRGCLSEISKESCADRCVTCDVNNCNNQDYLVDQKRRCIDCKETDEKCPWSFNKNQAVDCQAKVEYYQKPSCFTYTNDKKVTRGCTLGSDVCSKQNTNCTFCETDGCNNEGTVSTTCIRCRNDNPGEKTCEETATGIAPSKCDKAVEFEKKGCYVERDGKYVIRGCLADLGEELYAKCKDKDYKYCVSCDTENCNNMKAPNGVGRSTMSIFLLGIGMTLSKWL